MPTFSQPIVDNQMVLNVGLSLRAGEPRHFFKALLDTGAQITAISPNVVGQLGLNPISPLSLEVANGQAVSTFEYRAWVDIPIQYSHATPEGGADSFFSGRELSVAGLTYNPDGYDVILGMDLIGIFHVTIYSNVIILSN